MTVISNALPLSKGNGRSQGRQAPGSQEELLSADLVYSGLSEMLRVCGGSAHMADKAAALCLSCGHVLNLY